jgi:peptidoglycan/xylan/chitin deacetylase (PgdA/CDA1 family)
MCSGTSIDSGVDVLLQSVVLSLAVLAASPPPRIIILGYHEVEKDGLPAHAVIPRETASPTQDERSLFTISTETFRQQLDTLAASGYSVVALSDVVDYLAGRRLTLPQRSVVLTVDDGWRSVATDFADEMTARRWPFTVFIYPRVIDNSHHPYNLTWAEVEEVEKEGADVESHSYSHPFLSRTRYPAMSEQAYDEFLDKELRGSCETITKHTDRTVQFLAYPYGDYDKQVKAAANAAGYSAAVTVNPGVITKGSDRFALPRYMVLHDTTMKQFEEWLQGP